MSIRRKPKKSRKRLAYGVIAAIVILACFLAYASLHQSNRKPSNQNHPTLPPKAAIVDQLSFRNETKNPAFKNSCTNILETAGFNVTYYPGENVTVDFYKNLAWQHYGLIVLRVHSAIIDNGTELGLFTSELFNKSKYNTSSAPYYEDVLKKRLVEAYFTEQEHEQGINYFAIAPGFIETYATFHNTVINNTVIIMMGCDGLKYNTTAEAFINRGAKVCIGWDGPVSTTHTDNATTCLLQHLAQGNTVEEAVNKTMNEVGPDAYNNSLKYYPQTAGSYTIQYTLGISSMDTMKANTILVKEEKKGTKSNWL
jgi:hypothetical protein